MGEEPDRAEALGEILNLRHLLHFTVDTLRLLAIGRAIRAGVPPEFHRLPAEEQERVWGFARMTDAAAGEFDTRLTAHRRYLERAVEGQACALLELHGGDLRYLDRLLNVWVRTRSKGRARSLLDQLAVTLQDEEGACAVTVAVIDGEVEVEQVPVPSGLRQRAKGRTSDSDQQRSG